MGKPIQGEAKLLLGGIHGENGDIGVPGRWVEEKQMASGKGKEESRPKKTRGWTK